MDLFDKSMSGVYRVCRFIPPCLVDFITFYNESNGPCVTSFSLSQIQVITLLDGFIGQKYVKKLALVSFCNRFIVAGTRTKLRMHSQNTRIKARVL